MSQPVDTQRIKKFREDRKLLPYDDVEVAKRMQKNRSNYSRSVNEGPITNVFLNKFYTAFEEELRELRKKHATLSKTDPDLTKVVLAFEQHCNQLLAENKLIYKEIKNIQQKLDAIIEGLEAKT